jgi:hypothetical protein
LGVEEDNKNKVSGNTQTSAIDDLLGIGFTDNNTNN